MIWWPEEVPTLIGINNSSRNSSSTSITLRQIYPRDAEDIYRACQDPLIARFTTLPADYSLDNAIAFCGPGAIKRHTNRTELVFVIQLDEVPGTGFAGVISLHSIDFPNQKSSIGYWLAKEARGKGIGTVAAELITEYGLMTMGFRRIDALVVVDNEPSKQLLINAGYQLEGILRQYSTSKDGTQVDMALFAATK